MTTTGEQWAAARAVVAELFTGLSVEIDRRTVKIAKVEQFPISTIPSGTLPCVIFALPEVRDYPERLDADWRVTTYMLLCGLFVADENVTTGARALDLFREAVLDAFDGAVGLNGMADYMRGPRVLPANAELFAGIQYPHTDFEFEIRVSGTKSVAL